jgi:hypothetical protein
MGHFGMFTKRAPVQEKFFKKIHRLKEDKFYQNVAQK